MLASILSDPLTLGLLGLVATAVVVALVVVLRRARRKQAQVAVIEAGFASLFPTTTSFGAPQELPMPRLLESRFARTVHKVETWHELLRHEQDGMLMRLVLVHAKVRAREKGKSALVDRYYPMARVEGIGVEIPELVVHESHGGSAGLMGMQALSLGIPELDAHYTCEGPDFRALKPFFREPIVATLIGFKSLPPGAPRIESKQSALLLSRPTEMDAYATQTADASQGQPLAFHHRRILWEAWQLGQAIREAHHRG